MRDPKLRTLEVVVLGQTPVLVVVEYLNLAAGKWLLAALIAVPLLLLSWFNMLAVHGQPGRREENGDHSRNAEP